MKPFFFKKFVVEQSRCIHKIGTDGVLLGAWTTFSSHSSILDIGTGSGVIALMMAQKYTNASIVAIEPDTDSYQEALQNFQMSIWKDRIKIFHKNLEEFANQQHVKFDLIVSNPPFYSADTISNDLRRASARNQQFLSPNNIFEFCQKNLTENGILSLILPYENLDSIKYELKNFDLFINELCIVYSKKSKIPNRMLLKIGRQNVFNSSELTIYNEDNTYTESYVILCKDFYLNM